MKVKELIEKLSKLDQERDIWIGYDYPYAVQEPAFEVFTDEEVERRNCIYERYGIPRIKLGDYIHYAE